MLVRDNKTVSNSINSSWSNFDYLIIIPLRNFVHKIWFVHQQNQSIVTSHSKYPGLFRGAKNSNRLTVILPLHLFVCFFVGHTIQSCIHTCSTYRDLKNCTFNLSCSHITKHRNNIGRNFLHLYRYSWAICIHIMSNKVPKCLIDWDYNNVCL